MCICICKMKTHLINCNNKQLVPVQLFCAEDPLALVGAKAIGHSAINMCLVELPERL